MPPHGGSPVTDPFLGARLKIGRARNHCDELHRTLPPWAKGSDDRFRIEVEPDTETGEDIVRIRLGDPKGGVPVRFSLLVGDAIHNMRSALDHLACALADRGTGCTKRTQFPIFDNHKKYCRKENRRLLDGIQPADEAIIESVQPYHVRDRFRAGQTAHDLKLNIALLAIGRLDNRDKHRLILPAIPIAPFGKEYYEFTNIAAPVTIRATPADWVRMAEGAELARLTGLQLLPGETKVKVKRRMPFTIVFGEPTTNWKRVWASRDNVAVSSPDLFTFLDLIEEFIGRF